MSQKNTAFLIILFAVLLSLSVSGKLEIFSSAPVQTYKPGTTQSPRPVLLPLDFQTIKNYLSPTPSPTINSKKIIPVSSRPASNSKSFESVNELQKSLNISLDLSGGGSPFGGKVLAVNYCDPICLSPYEMITVGAPVGGTFLVGPTTIYREYDYSVGNWVLGLANGFDVCLVLVFDTCEPIGAGPIVDIMGTSN